MVFTERIETVKFLQTHLAAKLGLADNAVAILRAQLPDTQIQQTVEDFWQDQLPVRLLIVLRRRLRKASTCISSRTGWSTSTSRGR